MALVCKKLLQALRKIEIKNPPPKQVAVFKRLSKNRRNSNTEIVK